MGNKDSGLNFELLNNDKLTNTLKPNFIKKATYFFILIGFGIGSIVSLLTIIIEDISYNLPIFSSITNIHNLIAPVILGILGIFAGIFYENRTTKQKIIYNAFFESQQALKLITDNLPSLVSYVSTDSKYLFANKTYAKWFNIHPQDIYGKHVSEILGEKVYNDVLPFLKKTFAGQITSFEGTRIYHNRRKHYMNVTLVPHFNNNSEVVGAIVLTNDITALRKRENRIKKQKRELQKINATKDKLFSIIAHDLKSPFNAILGFSQLLAEDYDSLEREEVISISKMLNQQSKDAYFLLSNLLDWARTQLKGIEPSKEIIDLKEFTNEIVDFIDDNAQMKNIKLSAEIKDNTRAFADRNLLYSVLQNLITNAIKFTPEEGKITVRAQEKTREIEMSVSDTGVGMTPEQLKSLFRPKTENNTTRGTNNENGTGLGLIICKEFIEKNGGKINVSSEKGAGSRFCFTIPRSQQQSATV